MKMLWQEKNIWYKCILKHFFFFCNYWFNQDDENTDVVCEPPKTIAVHDRCQVLVVGGGPSGVFVSYLTWQPYLLCKNIRFHKKSNKTSQNAKFHQVYLLPWLPGELVRMWYWWRSLDVLVELSRLLVWRLLLGTGRMMILDTIILMAVIWIWIN